MKTGIKKIILSAALRSVKPASDGGVLICSAPVPERNRGDQALLDVVLNHLRKKKVRRIGVITTSDHPITSFSEDENITIHSDVYHAFMTHHSFPEQLKFYRTAAKYRHMAVIGADVLDEGYGEERSAASINMIDAANKIGLATRIFGFSVNGYPSINLQARLNKISKNTRLLVRDPESFRRLEKSAIQGIEPVGDLAYLLEPASEESLPDKVKSFLSQHRGKIIGLNLTQVVMGDFKKDNHRLSVIGEACRLLAKNDGYAFLLIPHDEPEGISYLDKFQKGYFEDMSDQCKLISPLPHCKQLKRLVGFCTHLFTCRLHLGIAALGMGIPITGFPYQGKFEGQLELFKLGSESLIPQDNFPVNAETLYHLMKSRIDISDQLANEVVEAFPKVRDLALKNFDGMETGA